MTYITEPTKVVSCTGDSPKFHVNPGVAMFRAAGLHNSVEAHLRVVAGQYNICPLFAGLFGSRAKDYAGPGSDWDLYVVYQGPLMQYAKLLNAETHQQRGEEALPPQISYETRDEAVRIQLNFVSVDFFAQELGRNNLDFRMALDNCTWARGGDEQESSLLVTIFMELAEWVSLTYSAEKIKHTGLGRAAKVIKALKEGQEVRPSELTDGLYRLFSAWAVTQPQLLPEYVHNRTQTLEDLMRWYLNLENIKDRQVGKLYNCLLPRLRSGDWLEELETWKSEILHTMERLMPIISARPGQMPVALPAASMVEKRLQVANRLNEHFVKSLLKAGK